MTTEQKCKQYQEFISHIFIYDNDNFREYEKVQGLLECMRLIHRNPQTNNLFLMECIIDEINRITKK